MTRAELDALRFDNVAWNDNATLYGYEDHRTEYSLALYVSRNPYNGRWIWNATVKYVGAAHAAFNDFGEEGSIKDAQHKALEAFNKWQRAAQPGTGAAEGGDAI